MSLPRPPEAETIAVYADAWRKSRDEVNTILASRAENFAERPADGSWSAGELAEHLYLTQFFFARSIAICLSGKLGYDMDSVRPVEYDTIFNKVERAQGVKNPEKVTPANDWDLETAREKLDQAQAAMEKNLADKDVAIMSTRGYKHPIYGDLSLLDWLWVLTLHEEAHLEAMREKFGG